MPPGQRRATGLELGDGDFEIKYNRSGRPIRNCAGKKKSPGPDFVDLQALDDELSEFGDDLLLDDELRELEDEDEDEDEPPKKKRKIRVRSPSPTPPPLSPLPQQDPPSRPDSPEPLQPDTRPQLYLHDLEPINLTFNIAPGFSGPLKVQLDLSSVPLRSKSQKSLGTVGQPRKVESRQADNSKMGFLKLPPELRNKVYNLVFKDKSKFDFLSPTNIQHSSAFLRSCKQIYEEGRTVLYGENIFYFARNKEMRRPFWAAERKEIGYKDLRLFLKTIGPSNVSYMRHLWLCFDDATPSSTPHLKRSEERRYVHDGHLIECLKALATQAQLKKVTLTFWGRRALAMTDARFLEYLCKLKADKVEMKQPVNDSYYWHAPSRIHEDSKAVVVKEVTRKQKLYVEE
ncbi:hypothetical protein Vi05172_g8598 [Venturia inaequalis]|nr:hypothetical protein Vi05172_g8598 [Venturia inaequalis]